MTNHPHPLRCTACGAQGPDVGLAAEAVTEPGPREPLCDRCDALMGALLRRLIWQGFLRERATADDLADRADDDRARGRY